MSRAGNGCGKGWEGDGGQDEGRQKSAYLAMLQLPDRLEPGDLNGARLVLDRVVRAHEAGGWTNAERDRLVTMRKKWWKRAHGEDLRFNLYGWQAKGGRVARLPGSQTLTVMQKITRTLEAGQTHRRQRQRQRQKQTQTQPFGA